MTDSLAEDWIALWQSELAAMAADRELRESWTGLLALWGSTASTAAQMLSRQGSELRRPPPDRTAPDGAAGAAQPPGAAPAAAASDLGGDEARRLYERIAELESRLAAFERGNGGGPAGGRPARSGDS